MLITNDKWIFFFVEYKYDDFIHVFKDEFMQLHL
jgi:hypothetical protein